MRYFARSGGMQGFEELVQELGGQPQALLRAVGLPPGMFSNPDLYVPYPALARLLALAARQCEAPDFGVRLALRQGLEVLGPLGSFLCLQANIGDALQMLLRHMDFHAHGVLLETAQDGDEVVFRFGFAFGDDEDCDQLGALSLVQFWQGLRQVQPVPMAPLSLSLTLPLEGEWLRRPAKFDCPLVTGAPYNSLRYPQALLARPVAVGELLRRRLATQWRSAYPDTALTGQVRRVITALLPTGECSLGTVASMIGVHPRTLQQRLRVERQPYGELLREVRQTLACHYLQRTEMGVTTLALNLGFEDIASFTRAFRRWTGLSPSAWRQARGRDAF